MNDKDLAVARELKRRLSEVVSIVDLRVFGSRARGDHDEYSDMDVFIELESLSREDKEKISNIVWEVGYEHYLLIAPLIFTRYELEQTPLQASPVVENIIREGVAI